MGLHDSAPEGSLQDQTSGGKASTQFPHTVVGAPINFAPEQIDRLRRGLHAYRVFSSVNGKRPSWRVVQKRIDALRADARIKHLTTDQTISFGSKERLRRFALNLTRLDEVDRLVDIKRLLLKAGVFTEGGNSAPNDIRGEAIKLNGDLANQSKLTLFRIYGLSPSY